MGMLEKALEGGKFGVTVEMAPPKGYDFTEQLAVAELLKGKVHGVNVTDMQSACLKASSLGLCIKLKEAGLEPIVQVTGRDRSRMGIMGDMLSAAAFGIDTMLALRPSDRRRLQGVQAGLRSGFRRYPAYADLYGSYRKGLRRQ